MANNVTRRWDVIDDLLFNAHLRGSAALSPPSLVSANYNNNRSFLRQQSYGAKNNDIVCYHCAEKGHKSNACPNKVSGGVSGPSTQTRGQGVSRSQQVSSRTGSYPCHRFNRGVNCDQSICGFSHKCGICGKGQHPAVKCPFLPTDGN